MPFCIEHPTGLNPKTCLRHTVFCIDAQLTTAYNFMNNTFTSGTEHGSPFNVAHDTKSIRMKKAVKILFLLIFRGHHQHQLSLPHLLRLLLPNHHPLQQPHPFLLVGKLIPVPSMVLKFHILLNMKLWTIVKTFK